MVSVLVVEDEQEKKRLIMSCILAIDGVDRRDVVQVDNVSDAKQRISERTFDLMVLDLNIPRRGEDVPVSCGGLEVISFVRTNLKAHPPTYILGLTAFDDAFAAASVEFSSGLWKLARFSSNDESWKVWLRNAIEHLVRISKPPFRGDGRSFHFDCGVVVAIEEEQAAVEGLAENLSEFSLPHDHAVYQVFGIKSPFGLLRSVMLRSPVMGIAPAAVSTSSLIYNFRPRLLGTVGICAGVRGKVALGDVLIADPCFDWGGGKWVEEADGKRHFLPAPYQWRLDIAIRSIVASFSRNESFLQEIHSSFNGLKPDSPPAIHIDAMASGAAVIQAGALMIELRSQHKNLIGVDMENYAVFTAANHCSVPRPRVVAIKGVSDFGDHEKGESFRDFAAHASARVFWELARSLDWRA